MKTHRLVWMITLLFFVSGCTAYAPVRLPGDPAMENQSSEKAPKTPGRTGYSPGTLPDDPQQVSTNHLEKTDQTVKVGMVLRITLINGETVKGTVAQITKDALAFGKPGNYGLETESYAFKDIESMEAAQSTQLANITGIFMVVTIVVLVALGGSIAAGMSGEM